MKKELLKRVTSTIILEIAIHIEMCAKNQQRII